MPVASAGVEPVWLPRADAAVAEAQLDGVAAPVRDWVAQLADGSAAARASGLAAQLAALEELPADEPAQPV